MTRSPQVDPFFCGLPAPSKDAPSWRILDSCFDAARLLSAVAHWRHQAPSSRRLHYVALCNRAPSAAEVLAATAHDAALQDLAPELAGQCIGLLPGFHRLTLLQGSVLLTLCIGAPLAMLREQQFDADALLVDPADPTLPWDRWTVKALARCCRRGTALTFSHNPSAAVRELLAQGGFRLDDDDACFDPRWTVQRSRDTLRLSPAQPGRCAIVGAGLAGASVAAALARRGWQVQVLDSAPVPAAGASGLPAGLLVPHASVDDSPRSRLTRAGARLTLQQLRALLPESEGEAWQASGVLELRADDAAGWPLGNTPAGRDWAQPAEPLPEAPWSQGLTVPPASLWHAPAAWVKPQRLVQAWLDQPGVQWSPLSHVAAMQRETGRWLLLGSDGRTLADAEFVVLANACQAQRLLDGLRRTDPVWPSQLAKLPALQGMRGLVSWGPVPAAVADALPPFPVNGHGSLIPAVPTEAGLAWYAGATYEVESSPPMPPAEHHRVNRDKLARLLPAAAQALAPMFDSGEVAGWGQTRCVSADRLPLAGPIDAGAMPSLWLSAALGSRGLSFAVLCAELIAARLSGEPWPIEASLARHLHALRHAPKPHAPTH